MADEAQDQEGRHRRRCIAGKDAGKRGTVLRVLPAERRVRGREAEHGQAAHQAAAGAARVGGQQVIPGGVLEREAPLHISNVALVCPACGKPTRVGYRFNDGRQQGARLPHAAARTSTR